MSDVAEKLLAVSHVLVAALLLVARSVAVQLSLPAPDVAQILAATGASHGAAYALVDRLMAMLPSVYRGPGRPAKPASPVAPDGSTLTAAMLRYVLQHPGAVVACPAHAHYSDGVRRFVVELYDAHQDLGLEVFCAAVQIPLGTLKDWLCSPVAAPETATVFSTSTSEPSLLGAHVTALLEAYRSWQGTFRAFCAYAKTELRLPFSCAMIRRLLYVHHARTPEPRGASGRRTTALRGSFRTFFPGAQWVGDGMQIPVVVGKARFVYNLELHVDAHTDAFVGLSVSDAEDSAVVVDALRKGVDTTQGQPLALLLDNRPSNHTAEVRSALGDTLLMRATPQRPENKAHVEGAFGLFSQVLPPLVLDTTLSDREIGRRFLTIVAECWARTANHRPRADRAGMSRVELYGETPTPAQIDDAKRALQQLMHQQEQARRTLEMRRRPELLDMIDQKLQALGLIDPKRHIAVAIAGHPVDSIVAGFAIFEGKARASTLPDNVDGRYLLGIVSNVSTQKEGEYVTDAMIALRLELRDRMLAALVRDRDRLCQGDEQSCVVAACVDRTMQATSPLDRSFWITALADRLRTLDPTTRDVELRAACRRIHATFRVAPRERQDVARRLVEQALPTAAALGSMA